MYTVGQKLFYAPSKHYRRTPPHEVTVTAVGRKWVTIEMDSATRRTMRFESTDKRMVLDGGQHSSPGRCYLNREYYEAEQAVDARWRSFAKWIEAHRGEAPHGMTVERIEQAETLLKVYEEATP
jgi:hypothetical protein